MKSRMRLGQKLVTVVALLGSLAPALRSETFIIDTNKTYVAVSGSALGSAFQEQGPGSMTTHFSGQLVANLVGNTIQFTDGSSLAGLDSAAWQPKADGSAGSEPANFGASLAILLSNGKAAARKIQLNALSPVAILADGQFDSSGMVFSFPTNSVSTLAYRVTGLLAQSGAIQLTGYATNKVTTLASLTTTGDQQVLTVPVDAQFIFKLVSEGDTILKVKGEFVATRTTQVPLVLQPIRVQNQVVILRWTGIPGQAYQVEASPDLGTWQNKATNIVFPTSDYSWTGPATAIWEFFRVGR
jgi:hypothetical protein